MSALISVIIPIYNVEKYLDRCLQSLINQTYKDMEIILVDDGSTDGCPQICDGYAIKYENVIVIHKKNGGLSSARNAGLKVAKGEYIGFVDSDDWVSVDMYMYLFDLLQMKQADVAQINYILAYNENSKSLLDNEEIQTFKGKDILSYYMLTTTTTTGSYSVCRCLFTKKVLRDLYFREGKVNEDIDYKYIALLRACTFTVSNQVKYFYYQAGNSTSSGKLKKRDFDLYDAAEELCKLTEIEDRDDIRLMGEVKKARTAFSLLSRIAYYGVEETEVDKRYTINKLTKEHRQNLAILLKSPIPISRKICACLLAINIKCLECPLKLIQLKK